jgi:hypothetical protein
MAQAIGDGRGVRIDDHQHSPPGCRRERLQCIGALLHAPLLLTCRGAHLQLATPIADARYRATGKLNTVDLSSTAAQ